MVALVVYQFGDFSLHPGKFELCREGHRLKLERKPLELLVLLVTKHGQVVSRDEIAQRLWEREVFVDVEHGINTAIRKLRQTLGDSSDLPQYVQTISGSGYRFIAAVTAIETDVPGPAQTPVDPVDPPVEQEISPAANPPSAATRSRKRGLVAALSASALVAFAALTLAILLVVGLAVAVWYLRRPLPPPRLTEEYTQITRDGRPKEIAGTDGSRIYFNRDYDLQSTAQVSISGGDIAQASVALPLPSIMDVSPDGSNLLVTSADRGHGSLWKVEVPAGSLRRLLTDTWVVSAAWSPDGKSAVYSAGGDLDVIRSDATGARKLVALGGSPDSLSWSPDGSTIRLSKDDRLWEISSSGSGLHRLLSGWHPTSSQCCGRWTPDGKFFVFLSGGAFFDFNKRLPASQLWVLDERRSLFRRAPTEPVQLTSGPIRWYTPIPSKDGTKIFAQGVILRGELVRYDAPSRRLQPYLGGISAEFVTFSSDHQFVAYVTFPEGILWRANRDGSHPVKLTDPPLHPLNPHWSPDGSQILFSSYDAEGHMETYVISSQGGTPQALLPKDNEGQSDPSWSPDGHKIVFSTLVKIGEFNSVLRVLDLPSHQITTLPGSEGMWSPRWSPSGRFIAGIHTGPTGGLKVFDFETQRWSVLQLKSETGWPTWSSNSKFIYFLRAWDDPGVYRVRISDGNVERVVDLKGFRHTGAFTLWMGLDPQDTPMLIRDVGTDDIYALTLEEK